MTQTNEFVPIDEQKPSQAGWYGVLRCWDLTEGFIPGSIYFDEKTAAIDRNVTHFINRAFPSPKEAEQCAYEQDPNW